MFEVFALLVFFAAIPLPPGKQLALAVVYLVFAVTLVLTYKKPPMTIYTGNVLFVLNLTVLSGYLISRRIHRYRLSALAATLELERQAKSDPLTGIANRRAFMDWAQVEVARFDRSQQPLAVLMLDIDHFKRINDQFGHSTGDLLLVEFVRRIAACLRRYDQFARLGGEEFVVVLPDSDLAQAQMTAQRLRQSIASVPFAARGEPVAMTVSIGLTRLHAGETMIEAALRRADVGLYAAKDNGRDRVEVVG